MDVGGRDIEEKGQRRVTITEAEISAAIDEVVAEIVSEIQTTIDRVLEVAQIEIEHFSIMLRGEGGWLRGLDKRVSVATKLPVIVSKKAYEE
jgi:rod shape-determining protein MreB